MSGTPARTYPSRLDALVVLFMLLPLVTALTVVGTLAIRLPVFPGRGIVLTVLAATFAFSVWILSSTRYVIDASSLTVHSGPFRWVIALTDIRQVSATRDPRSAPATSLERLRIDYGAGRSLMVSPRERAEFIGDLRARGVHVSG